MTIYSVKKYEGDDIYSWAVFKDLTPEQRKQTMLFYPVKPIMDGMSRAEAIHQRDKLIKEAKMARVCPQRIINEAIRIINELDSHAEVLNDELLEAMQNNLHELDALQKALYRDGIINIEEHK